MRDELGGRSEVTLRSRHVQRCLEVVGGCNGGGGAPPQQQRHGRASPVRDGAVERRLAGLVCGVDARAAVEAAKPGEPEPKAFTPLKDAMVTFLKGCCAQV